MEHECVHVQSIIPTLCQAKLPSLDRASTLAYSMRFTMLALKRMLVIHLGSLSALSVSLLCGLVILEPSGDGLFVLGVEEIADLFDITDHCARANNQHRRFSQTLIPAKDTHKRQLGIERSPIDRRFATT